MEPYLNPHGKLIPCVVGRSDERRNWFNKLLVAYHEQHDFPIPPMSGGKELNKPAEIQSAMLEAGFRQSVILNEDYELIYRDEQEWWESKWTHGALCIGKYASGTAGKIP